MNCSFQKKISDFYEASVLIENGAIENKYKVDLLIKNMTNNATINLILANEYGALRQEFPVSYYEPLVIIVDKQGNYFLFI